MGIKTGARLSKFLAILNAFSGSAGLWPQEQDQSVFFAIWKEIAAIGKSRDDRRWSRAPGERQSGKPGPTGRPAESTARRSGGKEKQNSASARANSASERPGWTWTPEFLRWVRTLSAREEKERRLLRRGAEEVAAARAERRRRPAMWAGLRVDILRSTSTIIEEEGLGMVFIGMEFLKEEEDEKCFFGKWKR